MIWKTSFGLAPILFIMITLREGGEYANQKADKCIILAISCYVLAILILYHYMTLFFLIPVIIGCNYQSKYNSIEKGIKGENIVSKALSKLDDSYYLLNDINLPNSYGNIDHVLLGPNGIFVIETKYYSGWVSCDGDIWCKGYNDYPLKSISKQVKSNSFALSKFLEEKYNGSMWINPIIVFANSNINLRVYQPTVVVLKSHEACDYITSFRSTYQFSDIELKMISSTILSV